jgi:serine/threonine-protein kinase
MSPPDPLASDPPARHAPANPVASSLPGSLAAALADRYRVERALGAGGMATVYLAEDVRHRRKVAVKVLHPELSAVLGPERFLQEIEVTASLQHPHILPLFDSGSADGQLYYVMPYIEGETLRTRLERERQLPVPDALRIATEVADGLQYAHERRVIHRDVKPENILLQGGHALVADFGIALAVQQAGGARMTQTGLSLGTPQYMAPEQALGERTVDARADVYALGAVAYEMLAGEPPFTGPNAQAVMARVLTEAPRPLAAQRPSVPPHVAGAVHTALGKLAADRFASAADFARVLAGDPRSTSTSTSRGPAGASARAPRVSPGARSRRALAGALAGVGAIAVGGFAAWSRLRTPTLLPLPAVTATLLPPDGESFGDGSGLALSPDGTRLAFTARRGLARPRLLVRQLATGVDRELAGTEDAAFPAWSTDGRSLAFVARGQLRVVSAEGGPVATVCEVTAPFGLAWTPDGTILVAADPGGVIYRVPRTGGRLVAVTRRGPEPVHLLPSLLPDGRHFLYASRGASGIYVGDLETGAQRRILPRGGLATYVAPGYLLVEGEGVVFAQRFDLRRDTVVGDPVEIARASTTPGGPMVTASATGVLVYQPRPTGAAQRLVVDRRGAVVDSVPQDFTGTSRLSPDGGRAAQGQWVRDLRRGVAQKLPPGLAFTFHATWSPDGAWLALDGFRDASRRGAIRVTRADGGGDDRYLPMPPGPPESGYVVDWTADGRSLVLAAAVDSMSERRALWLLDLATATPRRWLAVPGTINRARLSRDGRWVAYESDETGRSEIYVRPFPGPGRRCSSRRREAWHRPGAPMGGSSTMSRPTAT